MPWATWRLVMPFVWPEPIADRGSQGAGLNEWFATISALSRIEMTQQADVNVSSLRGEGDERRA